MDAPGPDSKIPKIASILFFVAGIGILILDWLILPGLWHRNLNINQKYSMGIVSVSLPIYFFTMAGKYWRDDNPEEDRQELLAKPSKAFLISLLLIFVAVVAGLFITIHVFRVR